MAWRRTVRRKVSHHGATGHPSNAQPTHQQARAGANIEHDRGAAVGPAEQRHSLLERPAVGLVSVGVTQHGGHLRRRHRGVERALYVLHLCPGQAAIFHIQLRRQQNCGNGTVWEWHRHHRRFLCGCSLNNTRRHVSCYKYCARRSAHELAAFLGDCSPQNAQLHQLQRLRTYRLPSTCLLVHVSEVASVVYKPETPARKPETTTARSEKLMAGVIYSPPIGLHSVRSTVDDSALYGQAASMNRNPMRPPSSSRQLGGRSWQDKVNAANSSANSSSRTGTHTA